MNSLDYLKEIQDNLKWKNWYNSRLNIIKKDLEELQQIKNNWRRERNEISNSSYQIS